MCGLDKINLFWLIAKGVSRKRQMGGTKQMVQLIYLKQLLITMLNEILPHYVTMFMSGLHSIHENTFQHSFPISNSNNALLEIYI